MKKILLFLSIMATVGITTRAKAQASCPIITNFLVVPEGAGNWHVEFNYENPTSGNKWVSVEVLCNSTQVQAPTGLNCFPAPVDGSVLFYSSAIFACPNIANMDIFIRSHTGNNCGGTVCQIQRSVAGSPLPVLFKSFDASKNNSSVSLKRVTATEVNNTGFEIQRRIGTGNWE